MSATLTVADVGGTSAYLLRGAVPPDIRNVWGATYLKGLQCWGFPAFRPVHERVVDDIQKVLSRTHTPLHIESDVTDYLLRADAFEEFPDTFSFLTQPFQHQLDGLRWVYNLPRSGLFYDPGLGKTKIMVDLYRATRQPMLILCPKIVLGTWRAQFKTHGEIDDVVLLTGTKKKQLLEQLKERYPVAVVTTYETAASLVQSLLPLPFKTLVLDESHRIMQITSIRTRCTLMLSEGRARRVLLSGTPTLGQPFSVYSQLRALGRYFAPESWPEYKKTYAIMSPNNEHQVLGYKNLENLNARVNELCIRRKKEECLDLPPQQVVDVLFEVSAEQRAAYNQIIEHHGDPLGTAEGYAAQAGALTRLDGPLRPAPFVWAPDTVSRLNKLEQIVGGFINRTQENLGLCNGCPHLEGCVEGGVRPYTPGCAVATRKPVTPYLFKDNARKEAGKELLEDLLASPDNKCIVWTRYIAELEMVTELAQELGVDYVVVRGGMTLDAFEAAMERFNTEPACRLYLGQVASGIGVTLNAANYTLYYSLPWSHEHYVQSLARNHRIGQDRKVVVYRLLAAGSADIPKAAALDQKIEIEHLLTSADYTPYCPVHAKDSFETEGGCTCDGQVMRIVTSLSRI